MMFSVMSDKEYATCKKAKAHLQLLLREIDRFLGSKDVVRAWQLSMDGVQKYSLLDWGATEDEEEVISFNREVDKFDGFYLEGRAIPFWRLIEVVQEAEEREADRIADRIAQRESDTPTTDTEEESERPDLSYPTLETMDLVFDLRDQQAKIKECLEVGVCPKCGKPGIDYQTFPTLHYLCKSCGWDWEERE